MRRQMRALISILAAMALGVMSAFLSAVALGATALIVPGTGTPDPDNVAHYRENAWNRYIDGVACTGDACANPVLDGIPYPASFWPMTFIPGWCVPGRCEKWDVSVDEGVARLKDALLPLLTPTSSEEVFIFGYSQGGAVVANALHYLDGLDLAAAVKARLKVVTIGGIENPDGGLWQRFAWLRHLLGTPVPGLDITFEPPMPVDTGIHTTSIGFEYDPVVYAPRFWGNPFAVLNAIAAFDTVHGYYLSPDGDDAPDATMPYGYTPETLAPQLNCAVNEQNCRTDGFGNTYIMIPATSLPLTDLVRTWADEARIGWLADPLVDLVEPVLRQIVDLGYDWSGDPGVPRGMSVLPFKLFQNWIKVGIDLVVAAVEGVEAFLGNFVETPTATTELETDREPAPRTENKQAVQDTNDANDAVGEVEEIELTERDEHDEADEDTSEPDDAADTGRTVRLPDKDRSASSDGPRTKRTRAAA
ncbi:PE-PPE domain-containing protein [Mycobacterium sp. SMC-4]|uniref:PE-PPE domain-containing protein n=1 Tax=Mycobacterium sp. SMC-4 TaxID=2857059 RepID=UPI003CFFEB71